VKKGQELDWKGGDVEEVRMVDSNEKFSESYMDLEIFSQLKIALLSCGGKHS
jgi:hypothetical protein